MGQRRTVSTLESDKAGPCHTVATCCLDCILDWDDSSLVWVDLLQCFFFLWILYVGRGLSIAN